MCLPLMLAEVPGATRGVRAFLVCVVACVRVFGCVSERVSDCKFCDA
jgi:hypothetical protein